MMNRVFTVEELKEMGTRTVDLLTQAIEDDEKVCPLTYERIRRECSSG